MNAQEHGIDKIKRSKKQYHCQIKDLEFNMMNTVLCKRREQDFFKTKAGLLGFRAVDRGERQDCESVQSKSPFTFILGWIVELLVPNITPWKWTKLKKDSRCVTTRSFQR